MVRILVRGCLILFAAAVATYATLALAADKIVTYRATWAVVDSVHLTNRYDGGYAMVACGHTRINGASAAEVSEQTCHACDASLPVSGAVMLACWKNGEGL